jgi:hypothetical protein
LKYIKEEKEVNLEDTTGSEDRRRVEGVGGD